MAITKTGAIFNSLVFGGVDSAEYGIYITGEGVYNAPERAVELVSVPGRNGAIAIDQGHWENVEVEYPAGAFANSQSEFATAMSDFRNAIVSQIGYQRLTDSYHPDEYRMAMYVEGLEVEPGRYDNGQVGEFTIKFNCKPQRWLTSGETAISVDSGDTITNPTMLDASPLIETWGYGNIKIGDQVITIQEVDVGDVLVGSASGQSTVDLNLTQLNDGDSINVSGATLEVTYSRRYPEVTKVTISNARDMVNCVASNTSSDVTLVINDLICSKGTSNTISASASATITIQKSSGAITTSRIEINVSVSYDGNNTLKMSQNHTSFTNVRASVDYNWPNIYGYSSKTALGHPMYIDTEIGQAYNADSGTPLSVDFAVNFGSDLPKLPPGDTEITFDNTFDDIQIVPRWWRL